MPNPWPTFPGIPSPAAAVLAALHLVEPRVDGLAGLTNERWREALDFSDRGQLTLSLRRGPAREVMPQWVRETIDGCAARNVERLRLLEELYRVLNHRLTAAGIEFLALKGLSNCPLFGAQPEDRAQYDIDLYTPKEQVFAARDVLLPLGFESMEVVDSLPDDHIPALIRKTGWEWRGDHFDPEMPLAVELHFQFWNETTERLPAGTAEFWERRVRRTIAGVELAALCPADALGYSALHLLKHILRGNARSFHIYEFARFLHNHSNDAGFWSGWRTCHGPELRRLEAVMFRLAAEWFGCELGPAAQEEIAWLPAATRAWFEDFALSPATCMFHTGKDELWLHLSLLKSKRDAFAVARRRLLPAKLPGAVDAIHVPQTGMTWRRRALKNLRYTAFVFGRLRHHAVSLPLAAGSGARWWLKTNRLGSQFWIFLAAAVLFNFAFFIFVLLYNLHLLDLGFREDFLGFVSGAGTAGCVAGTLPAAVCARRFGLRKTLLGTVAGCAAIAALRALVTARIPLIALAFASGLVFAAWAVIMAPTIAAAVEEKRRPAAYSIFFATMFTVGIAGGWVGGQLPAWVHGTQAALLTAAGLSAIALWPAWRLKPAPAPPAETRVFPRTPFLARYLFPFALWNLATGSFNPFFNVYFKRMGFGVERIGTMFSISQLMQVATVLLAPAVLRRAGLVNGIAWMMAAAAVGLGCLAAQPPGAAAALAYIAYMAFQWMSEPGLSTLLMNNIPERGRSGASALNYLVAFSAQAVAAVGAGALVSRFGYAAVLAGSAAMALVAAGCFRGLVIGHVAKPAQAELESAA